MDELSELITSKATRMVITFNEKTDGLNLHRINNCLDVIRTHSRCILIKHFPSTLDEKICNHIKIDYQEFLKLQEKPKMVFADTKEK